MKYKILVMGLLLALIGTPGFASPSFLGGYSGSIFVPDGSTAKEGEWTLSFHDSVNAVKSVTDIKSIGVIYGMSSRLELGVSFVKLTGKSVGGQTSERGAINGKYRIIDETASIPEVAIGIFDAAGEANFLNKNPSIYVAATKDITPFATHIAGRPINPIKITIGGGTGIFDGLMAGMDYTINPHLRAELEYFGGHLESSNHLTDAALRYDISKNFTLDVGTTDFKFFAFGANLRSKFN